MSKPERAVHKHLEKIGIKHRHNISVKGLLHPTEEFPHLNMHPFDIVVEDLKTVVEIMGCYWHLCPVCHPELVEEYSKNPSKFKVDLLLNKRKDAEIKRQIEAVGWNYEEIWQHEIEEIIDEYSDEINSEDNAQVEYESIPLW
jgi:G:T-mismatch repair DNA endonuclease (very short patch repair protein)